MGRPRDNKCRECRKDLPVEWARDELTAGTDVCLRCASVTLARIRRASPAARVWMQTWFERLRHVLAVPRQ